MYARRYVLFWNLSLQMNPVGFYQLSKICVTPAVIALDFVWFQKRPTIGELQAVGVLCLGVLLATVTDSQVLLCKFAKTPYIMFLQGLALHGSHLGA